jgi:hypothetical protein
VFVRVDVLVFDVGSELDGVSASTVSESGSEVMEVLAESFASFLPSFGAPQL